jgi:hypothetical protein
MVSSSGFAAANSTTTAGCHARILKYKTSVDESIRTVLWQFYMAEKDGTELDANSLRIISDAARTERAILALEAGKEIGPREEMILSRICAAKSIDADRISLILESLEN